MLGSAVLLFAIVACTKDSQQQLDAGVKPVDAKLNDAKLIDAPRPIDAALDAPPDAPNMNVVTACMHACDAIFVCLNEPVDGECYSECAEDLADCSAQQVAEIDACTSEACGDIENKDSPLLTCIMGVTCIDMALARPRSR